MPARNYLQFFIEDLVLALENDEELDIDLKLSQISELRDRLEATQEKYTIQTDEELKPISDEMIAILEHFLVALDCIEDFVEDLELCALEEALEENELGARRMQKLQHTAEKQSGRLLISA